MRRRTTASADERSAASRSTGPIRNPGQDPAHRPRHLHLRREGQERAERRRDAAVVANNVAGPPIGMGGADPTITIPSIMIQPGRRAPPSSRNLPAAATLSPDDDLLPDRDSDLDSGVIIHEYGHGVSNRLTGGHRRLDCLQNVRADGRGLERLLALDADGRLSPIRPTTARGMGTYVVFQGPRRRRHPADPVHDRHEGQPRHLPGLVDDDTARCHPLDPARGRIRLGQHGLGGLLEPGRSSTASTRTSMTAGTRAGTTWPLQLVIDGMKFQPCNPGFVDGRDAHPAGGLALTGGENQCLIWEGFAKRGLGFSAEQGSSARRPVTERPPSTCHRSARERAWCADRAHRPGHRHRSRASPAATPMDAPRFGARPLTSV